MTYPKKKVSSGSKGIVIIVIFIVLIITTFTMLSFIPIMGETILFADVDVIDLGEIVISVSVLVGVSMIFFILIFRKNYKKRN